MDTFSVNLPKGLVPYSLFIAPSAMKVIAEANEFDCIMLKQKITDLALQPPKVKPDEGFPGKLERLKLEDNRGKISYVVLYLIDSATRSVTVLGITPPKERYKLWSKIVT